MKLSILTNDKAKPGYFAEHGLSVYVDLPYAKILFDTGFTQVFLKNAEKLGINLNNTDYLILSHGHYDHTGGLLYLTPVTNLTNLIIHKDAFVPKYAMETPIRYNGIPYSKDKLGWTDNIRLEVEGFLNVAPNIYVVGNIPHDNYQTKYYTDSTPDDFHDEIILIIEEKDGLNLFMGCSHYGVIEGIEEVRRNLPYKRIINILAGMHLGQSDFSEIIVIADYLEKLNLNKLMPLHCTGEKAMNYFKDRFKEKCLLLEAGDEIEI